MTFRPAVLPFLAATFLLPLGLAANAQEVPVSAQRDLTLTLYQGDLALVHDSRWLTLKPGENHLSLMGTSQRMLPESLQLTGLDDTVRLIDMGQSPATLTPQRLLRDAVGQRVQLRTVDPSLGEEKLEPATLLSIEGGLVLDVGGRTVMLPYDPERIVLEQREPDLQAEPSLTLRLYGEAAGGQTVTLAYLTHGLGWKADYVAELDADGKHATLSAYVSVTNGTGTSFNKAKLRLVAGEVRSLTPVQPLPAPMLRSATAEAAPMAMDQAAAAPVAISDRYLYDTGLEIDIDPAEQRAFVLFEDRRLPVERLYEFDGLATAQNIEKSNPAHAAIRLRFTNTPEKGEAQPLPAGVVRAYEPEKNGPSLFVGEDRIPHSPADGSFEVALGEAFDVTATSRQVNFERLSKEGSYEATQEMVVTNAKTEAVTVELTGRFAGDWRMLDESVPHEKKDSRTALWRLTVPAGGEVKLDYRVRVNR